MLIRPEHYSLLWGSRCVSPPSGKGTRGRQRGGRFGKGKDKPLEKPVLCDLRVGPSAVSGKRRKPAAPGSVCFSSWILAERPKEGSLWPGGALRSHWWLSTAGSPGQPCRAAVKARDWVPASCGHRPLQDGAEESFASRQPSQSPAWEAGVGSEPIPGDSYPDPTRLSGCPLGTW